MSFFERIVPVGNRLNSQSDDPGTGNFPRMGGGGGQQNQFFKSGVYILTLA